MKPQHALGPAFFTLYIYIHGCGRKRGGGGGGVVVGVVVRDGVFEVC